MVRYLLISAIVNLILFTWLSMVLYQTTKITISLAEKKLPPLAVIITEPPPVRKVAVQTQSERESALKASVQTQPSVKKAQKTKPKTEEKPKPSLLETLLPEVEKELQNEPRVVQTSATVKLSSQNADLGFKRKVIYAPPVEPIEVEYPPSPAVVKITVLPDGRVVSAVFVKRSGNAKVDEAILNFLKNIRFEPIKSKEVQEITVRIEFTF